MESEVEGKKASFGQSFTSFAGAILLVLSIRWLLFEPYVIPSGSMIPTLLIHDHILVNKLAFGIRVPFTKQWLVRFADPGRGDILVFRSVEDDGYFMIKRVVGVAGDEIAYKEDGQLLINGEPVAHKLMESPLQAASQEPFYSVTPTDIGPNSDDLDFYNDKIGEKSFRTLLARDGFRFSIPATKVGEGKLYMMGDNRDNSKDSRYWGELPVDHVLGRATFVWLSCEETFSFASFLCNPLTIRWRRFFHGIH